MSKTAEATDPLRPEADEPTALDEPEAENVGSLPHSSATYSPEDNKLRLSCLTRLDKPIYDRLKAAGFSWAPKQKFFVAPMWTPERADLLIELCGEIGDEDTSLAERAEDRADRFEGYGENRKRDAESARKAVAAIADNIPLGQPILVGHHSERHARRDAKRIENGMRKTVRMWECAEYWTRRAAGAIRNAKYKERPDVRHRRIKGLEADLRKREKQIKEAETFTKLWQRPGLTAEQARAVANYDHVYVMVEGKPSGCHLWSELDAGRMTPAAAAEIAIAAHARQIEWSRRWAAHIENRLAYERAMLAEGGGLKADKFKIEVGGQVLVGREWAVVLRVNRKGGEIVSVRTTARYVGLRGIEDVTDYRPPQGDDAAKVKAATKLPPLCNYPGEGFQQMTKAEWDRKPRDYRATRVAKATETQGAYRYRSAFVPGGSFRTAQVYITDAKRVDPPAPAGAAPELPAPNLPDPAPRPAAPKPKPPEAAAYEAMRQQLKTGVKVVSAPQLFPTPAAVASQMAEVARLETGHRILEPSAGTGNLLRAIADSGADCTIVAVELNVSLAEQLRGLSLAGEVLQADFLECSDLGTFDRILMNPPFADGQDIEHILHARKMLRPGGRLVAICANGPRQNKALRPLVVACGGTWEELPEGTFAGTGVRAVLLSLE